MPCVIYKAGFTFHRQHERFIYDVQCITLHYITLHCNEQIWTRCSLVYSHRLQAHMSDITRQLLWSDFFVFPLLSLIKYLITRKYLLNL